MDIKRSGSQPSSKGPAEYFTGTVRIDPLFKPDDPARALGASVTFEPGARTAWHAHPLGQILIVTAGCGLAQRWGGPIEEIRPGDVIWFPPGEKHWHDATATTAMTHIAIVEKLGGKSADWMEKVSDEQYHLFIARADYQNKEKEMPQYVIVYLGGDQPSSPEEGQQHFSKYMDWLASLGDSAVSPANPLKNTSTVNSDGTVTTGGTTTMSGYTIIEADSMEAALSIAQACPFLDIGGSLEVSEFVEMPSQK